MDSHTSTEVFDAGDTILKAGEAGDGRVFFIESGRVSVLVPLDEGGTSAPPRWRPTTRCAAACCT